MVLIHWAERYDRMRLVGAGAFLLCAGFGLLPLGSSLGYAALTVVIWTTGEMLALPLSGAVVVDRSGPGNSGRYMGVYSLSFGVAFLIAPVIGTWVYGAYGPATLWYGIGMLGMPLLVGAMLLSRWLAARQVETGARIAANLVDPEIETGADITKNVADPETVTGADIAKSREKESNEK